MSNEKGNLSINSENIFPIIKKWLYSDSDIFVRELVSNASDAITKLKKLCEMGEAPTILDSYSINVTLDSTNKTITIEDNGIGLTADEIKQYINQIAFSGATDFLDKYKDKLDKDNEIIGHFGLGFYSSFMVSEKVQIDSLSYKEGSKAARWVCDGGIEYELSDSDKQDRGTKITLFISEDSKDFLNEFTLKKILNKYCSFIPVEIFLDVVKEKEDTTDEKEDISESKQPINETTPLWLKPANECSDEDYKSFYQKVFSDFNEPLFWIHLNMDYPFKLKGILYFPKLKHELESIEGQVKLYNNQVFIADNIKEVIPEFLLLLKGTIDCPDLPLNVSRSFLQNDGYVTKMSGYITKKVADKLNSLFKKDRDTFNKYWEDISPFIKYGCIKEKDFYEKIKSSIVFKTTIGDHATLSEFLERNKDKTADKVYYVSDENQQSQYIKMFKDYDMEAVILPTRLDNAFISYLESFESNVKFKRIDSDISDMLKDTDQVDTETNESLEKLFRDKLKNETLTVQVESLKSETISGIILLSEEARRMQEMSKMFGSFMQNMPKSNETLILNKNSTLVKLLLSTKEDESKAEEVETICEHIYDLAMMSHKPLEPDAMTKFIERSNKILERSIKA